MRIKKAVGMAVVLLMLGIGGCTSADKTPAQEAFVEAAAAVSEDEAVEPAQTTDVNRPDVSEDTVSADRAQDKDTDDEQTGVETLSEDLIPEKKAEKKKTPRTVVSFAGRRYLSDTHYADISGTDLRNNDIEELLSSLKELDTVRMQNCGLGNDGYAAIQDAHPEIRFIWNIRVRNWTIPTDTVAFSTLIGWPGNSPLYDNDAKYFRYCTDMVALDLGHCYITDFGFLEYMPELKILIIVENYTYPDSHRRLKDISPVRFCKKLRYFEFFANDVEDISVIAELKELEDLNLCYNWTRTADPIKDLPHLKRLWIYGTRIPSADLEKLREIYPDVQIVTSGAGSVDQGWRSGERYTAMRDMVINNRIDPIYAVDATTYEETLMTAPYPVEEPEETEASQEETVSENEIVTEDETKEEGTADEK